MSYFATYYDVPSLLRQTLLGPTYNTPSVFRLADYFTISLDVVRYSYQHRPKPSKLLPALGCKPQTVIIAIR